MSAPLPQPGWYADPEGGPGQRYWDGTGWVDPPDGPPEPSGNNRGKAVAVGVCVLSGIGVVMSMQSASLLTGTGTIWAGVGLAAAGLAAAFFLGAEKWVRVVAAALLGIAVFSAGYMEKQLNDTRNEISRVVQPNAAPAIPTPTTSPKPTVAPIAPPGAVVRDGTFEFQITDVSSVKTIGDNPYLQHTAEDVYVVFTLDVTNIGHESDYVWLHEQKLIDANNRQYLPVAEVDSMLNDGGSISPGATATVKMAFDVPQSIKMKALELHGGMWTDGVRVAAGAAPVGG